METRILVVSDSHGSCSRLDAIIREAQPFDCLVHCGDGAEDLARVSVPDGVRVIQVSGNMDHRRIPGISRVVCEQIGGRKVMVTHGHTFKAHADTGRLLDAGRKAGADLILFGHTHVKSLQEGTPILFNPGPANSGLYGIIIIGEDIRCGHRKIKAAD